MTQNYPKRLIEVDLPIRRISEHARNEKDSRQGHIPQLHIYPAARPVAACRGVICAALWPDPVDLAKWHEREEDESSEPDIAVRPDRFLDDAKSMMLTWANNHLKRASEKSYSRLLQLQKNPTLIDDLKNLRLLLLDFIADFSKWENSNDKAYLDTARRLTRAAHEALGGAPGTRPLLVDPFAGGGAIPLEALRVGADSFASDLNPVATLLNRVIEEYVPKYGQKLAPALQAWRDWIQTRASDRLAKYFPKHPDGSSPVAYLWARTIISEAPAQEDDVPVEVPLLRTLWLQRTKRCMRALRWIRDDNGKIQTEIVSVTYIDERTRKIRRPLLEIFEPKTFREVPDGTVKRGSVTCPITGYTTPIESVRRQLESRRGGANDARLYCVVVDPPNGGSRDFRLATPADFEAALSAAQELHRRIMASKQASTFTITEPLPEPGTLGFRVQRYGMKQWGDLFIGRQLLALGEYCELSKEYINTLEHNDPDFAQALNHCVALVIGRLADQNASLSTWQLNTLNSAHVFVRWVLQMVWDFAEVNPLAGAGGSPDSAIRRMMACLSNLSQAQLSRGRIEQSSADKSPLPDNAAQALVTDPPYYDAIPYADLLDFFYVWEKRVLSHTNVRVSDELCPKTDECIVNEVKGKDADYFGRMMTRCLSEQRRVLAPSGIGVIVFAHKSTGGWERLLKSVIDAGLFITGSWPIDTELDIRMRAKASATLSSSVHLVCRPREDLAGSVREHEIGDWRDVLQELPRRIHEWMPRLAHEGVVGADAIFACLGPALEIFSRYSRVEKASGEAVTLKEYLEHVWAAVAKEALTMVFEGADASGFEPDARLTAMWLWTLNANANGKNGKPEADEEEDEESEGGAKKKTKAGGFVLEYDAARKIAQGLGANLDALDSLVEVSGETARLLPVAERARHLFGKEAGKVGPQRKKREPQMNLFKVLEAATDEESSFGEVKASRLGETILDRVHQSMILFAAGRSEALKRFLVDDGAGSDQRFWRLAQALSALYPKQVEEKRWVDGVMARKKGLGF